MVEEHKTKIYLLMSLLVIPVICMIAIFAENYNGMCKAKGCIEERNYDSNYCYKHECYWKYCKEIVYTDSKFCYAHMIRINQENAELYAQTSNQINKPVNLKLKEYNIRVGMDESLIAVFDMKNEG